MAFGIHGTSGAQALVSAGLTLPLVLQSGTLGIHLTRVPSLGIAVCSSGAAWGES